MTDNQVIDNQVTDTENAVAVVGMACRYPGAGNVEEFWELLRDGVEGITRFDVEDLVRNKGADPVEVRQPNFVPAKGVMADSAKFDWSFFGYSRSEASGIDPQQRVFLETAATALDDAGLDPTRFDGWIGVYAGADRTHTDSGRDLSPLERLIGLEKDHVATRVAYKLGLRGPAVTVQTSCSTSLVAIHMAVQSLLNRECDAALAGGVAVAPEGEWGYWHEPGGPLSSDGRTRPFDAHATGTVPSEGVGVVVLKRLADALQDGDRIAAVVLGSALNNDGADKMGYTTPSIPGQRDVILYAQKLAGVNAADIDYVEAHGTATPIGDPVEVQALTEAFRASTAENGYCLLGGVKGNIGHTSAAAGVAAFIKTTLMLERGELVPSLHFDAPNPLLELESTPFRVCTEHAPWPDRGTRLAAVSSFGVGGTNAHVVLQGPPARQPEASSPGGTVLALSAASPEALGKLRADLAGVLRRDPAPDLAAVARTLAERRVHRHRQAFAVSDPAHAAEQLAAAGDPTGSRPLGKVAFLFPGHGTLRYNAGAGAYRLLPGFRDRFDELREAVLERCGVDLSPVVAPTHGGPEWFDDGVNQQLGLFALGYALGRQLMDWGITPVGMFGNSIGEFAPAALAGVWSPADAAVLVHERARATWAVGPPGRMVAVSGTAEEVLGRLGPDSAVEVSMISRGGVVLSGPQSDVDAVLAGDALVGLDLRVLAVDRPGHCSALAPVAEILRGVVANTPAKPAALPLVSDTTGTWADPAAVTEPEYWAAQLTRPVLLDAGVATLLDAGVDTFLELGPGSTMLGTVRWNGRWDGTGTALPLLGRAEDGELGVLRALGALWERGFDVLGGTALAPPPGAEPPLRLSLPPHPFLGENPVGDRTARVAHRKREHRATSGDTGSLRAALERLWATALDRPPASDADHFYAQGGESLMALSMMSRLREQTGVVVSLAEFSREPTFGRLLELAERDRPAAPAPRLPVSAARLREGSGRPLFLAADAAGTAVSYQALADRLDVDRPVYGLEVDPEDRTHRSLARIAAQHVDAVLAVQPEGPYTLGGWSFGAVVAHEMARLLIARGAEVDVLLCIDAFIPGRRGLPVGLDPEFLYSHAFFQVAGAFNLGEVGRRMRHNPALRRIFLDKARVLAPYRPRAVHCPAVVFKVDVDARAADRLSARLAPLYGGGVRVRPVPGNHWSVLTEPHVRRLAEELITTLAGVEPVRNEVVDVR
ncbi:type I polyketide synthase [Saccharothrix texasensis]|uniref:Phthiocerol/phenolphthiocerol synthesis type-I polyketide synthase E n=1 Tax=Saccharothrix texasensis TaxID=103734 RepID=A0A3N1GZ69_9PSEU|nr:type I polyketide synthase [Saccharothrix texasensis]ROP35584.1 phthiocerol/phenolphthiocerol synthesis type-I polyketide synthase E [Saccharothrix texasensis]